MTTPAFGAFIAVAVGAVLGAWLRWGLVVWLNPRIEHLPLGTLSANLVGGFLVGLAVAAFGEHHDASPALRLFVVTGLLGALTTFSSFSAESVALLMRGNYGWALAHSGAHLLGSLALTALGIATYRAFA